MGPQHANPSVSGEKHGTEATGLPAGINQAGHSYTPWECSMVGCCALIDFTVSVRSRGDEFFLGAVRHAFLPMRG